MSGHESTMAVSIRDTLAVAMETDAAVSVLGECVGKMGGIAGCTQGLLERFGPDRVVDTPVADRGTLGMAIGMAFTGGRPVVELSSASRIQPLLAVLADAAETAISSDFSAPVVVRAPYGQEAGVLDRSVLAAMMEIPGLTVVAASSPASASSLLRLALTLSGPVVILEPRALYGSRISFDATPIDLCTAQSIRTGDDITIAGWGASVSTALEAAEQLAALSIQADVIDLVSLAPVDSASLGQRLQSTGRLLVAYDADAPFASIGLLAALEEAFIYLESPPSTAQAEVALIVAAARASVNY